uniref:Uncharacterized protein n=1 Tax=Arundo donax TaxID=35708 RepID=A0A0A9C1H1_ARUDO
MLCISGCIFVNLLHLFLFLLCIHASPSFVNLSSSYLP